MATGDLPSVSHQHKRRPVVGVRVTGRSLLLGLVRTKPPVTTVALPLRLAEQQIDLRLPQRFHLGHFACTIGPSFVEVGHEQAGASVVDDLACIRSLTLSDFEPVNVSSLMVSNDSGATSH